MAKTNPERVVELLRSDGRWLCDDCVASMASLPHRNCVNPMTACLGMTSDFARERSTCARCRGFKYVTMAVRPAQPAPLRLAARA